MSIELAMEQMVNVPIALLYGSFVCGGVFFLILDGLSGLITILIRKATEKINKKKEHKERENGSNNS